MCLWRPTEQSYADICFSLQTYEDQSLREGKYSPVLSKPDGYMENIYILKKVLFA